VSMERTFSAMAEDSCWDDLRFNAHLRTP